MNLPDENRLEALWFILSLIQLIWFLPLVKFFPKKQLLVYVLLLVIDIFLIGLGLAYFSPDV